jgi:hypothetical protein
LGLGSNGHSVGNMAGTAESSQHKGFTVAGTGTGTKAQGPPGGNAEAGGARRYWWDHLVDSDDAGPGMRQISLSLSTLLANHPSNVLARGMWLCR